MILSKPIMPSKIVGQLRQLQKDLIFQDPGCSSGLMEELA